MPTLIVEDGTGLSTANAYISLADADAYFLARGIDAWAAASQTDREEAIIRGAQYIDTEYRWKGATTTREQAMAWPRIGSASGYSTGEMSLIVDDQTGWYVEADEIPVRVAKANAEAALAVINGTDLQPTLSRGGAIKAKTVKAGPVSTSTEYESGAGERDRVFTVESLLRGLVTGTPGASFGQGRIARS